MFGWSAPQTVSIKITISFPKSFSIGLDGRTIFIISEFRCSAVDSVSGSTIDIKVINKPDKYMILTSFIETEKGKGVALLMTEEGIYYVYFVELIVYQGHMVMACKYQLHDPFSGSFPQLRLLRSQSQRSVDGQKTNAVKTNVAVMQNPATFRVLYPLDVQDPIPHWHVPLNMETTYITNSWLTLLTVDEQTKILPCILPAGVSQAKYVGRYRDVLVFIDGEYSKAVIALDLKTGQLRKVFEVQDHANYKLRGNVIIGFRGKKITRYVINEPPRLVDMALRVSGLKGKEMQDQPFGLTTDYLGWRGEDWWMKQRTK